MFIFLCKQDSCFRHVVKSSMVFSFSYFVQLFFSLMHIMSCTELIMEVESTLYFYRSKNVSTGCQHNCKREIKLIKGLTKATKVTQIYMKIHILWLQLSKATTLSELDSQTNAKFANSFIDSKTIR